MIDKRPEVLSPEKEGEGGRMYSRIGIGHSQWEQQGATTRSSVPREEVDYEASWRYFKY
jgi:hypothetical protein